MEQYPVPSSAETSFAVLDRRLATASQKVIHYATNYKLDFNASKTYCESRGTSIAAYEDLDGAYKDGYQKCACGWAANGIAYLVMQAVIHGCGSSIGVIECSGQSTWDVFCKRRVAPGLFLSPSTPKDAFFLTLAKSSESFRMVWYPSMAFQSERLTITRRRPGSNSINVNLKIRSRYETFD